ncbi:cholecystokinin receptor-like [Ostrea edulis]|uniref:cholecystokinin receptor-like n=1 Tax=Ostrea edulis TaxID=37623 RepID=UPI0020940526|nr:cholecystokinin receptor-like [Ostrea edulis]XP_048776223.2 cholecystokinin receptor-like [Ostrea edulis]
MENSTYLSEKLDAWNSELASGLTPNNVILSLYIATSLLGNSTVILIYGFKMRGNKEERYFIPFLAMADLCASLVCASFGIALNMMQAEFNNTHLCKAWWFFAAFTTFTSILFLFIIAVHRYLKVCRPLGKQMILKWKRFALGLGLFVAFIHAVPMVHFYGSVPFPNEEEGIVGLRCSRLKTINKTGSLIFGGVIVLITVACIVTLIFLYAKIGYTILAHFKFSKSPCKPDTSSDTEKSSRINHSQVTISSRNDPLSGTENGTYSIETDNTELSESLPPQTSTKTTGKTLTTNTKLERKLNPYKSSAKRRKERNNQRVVHKFTLMFMLITIIFLICYIPKVIIMLLEARNPKFWEEFSDSARAGVLFVYRMYIINNITNPIIYAFLDEQFAKEIKSLFKVCK